MAPTTPAPVHDRTAELLAALARAKAERLVAFPSSHRPGLWECKDYHIRETGPRPQDVACDCADATFRGRICKHAVCVVFARKHHLRPIRPQAPAQPAPVPAARYCKGCGLSPVTDGFHYCRDCARPEREETLVAHVDHYGAGYVRGALVYLLLPAWRELAP